MPAHGVVAHQHRPRKQPVIPEDTARACHAVLLAQSQGENHPTTRKPVTHHEALAAAKLLQLFQTQDRYTPERVEELARKPKASEAIRDLDALTDEDLNALQAKMLASYPGKPS